MPFPPRVTPWFWSLFFGNTARLGYSVEALLWPPVENLLRFFPSLRLLWYISCISPLGFRHAPLTLRYPWTSYPLVSWIFFSRASHLFSISAYKTCSLSLLFTIFSSISYFTVFLRPCFTSVRSFWIFWRSLLTSAILSSLVSFGGAASMDFVEFFEFQDIFTTKSSNVIFKEPLESP